MNLTKYRNLIRFINTLCAYFIFITALAIIVSTKDGTSLKLILTCCILGLNIFWTYSVREHVDNFFVFMLLNFMPIIIYAVFFASGDTFYIIFNTAFLIVTSVISFSFRYAGNNEKISSVGFAPIIIIFFGFFIIEQGNNMLKTFASFNSFLFIMFVIANNYLLHTHDFVFTNNSAVGDLNDVKRYSSRFFKTFMVIIGSLSLLASILSSDFIIYKIKSFIQWLIKRFFDAISSPPKPTPEPSATPIPDPPLAPKIADGFFDEVDKHEMPESRLPDVPTWLIYTVCIVAVVVFLVLFFYIAYVNFTRKLVKENETKEFINPFVTKEKLKPAQTQKDKTEGLFYRGSYDMRIRKLFKKTVDRNMLGKIHPSDTPTEICVQSSGYAEHSNDYEELKRIYEKARYNEASSTKEEYQRALELSKIIN